MSMSIKRKTPVMTVSNTYKTPAKRLLLILILSFSLLFFACGGDDSDSSTGSHTPDSNPVTPAETQTSTDLSADTGTGGVITDTVIGNDTSPSDDDDTPPEEPETGSDYFSDDGDDDTGGIGDDGTAPEETETGTGLSIEARIELLKKILFTAYSGIGNADNTPLYHVMIKDLNELAITLALKAFQPQDMAGLFQHEDLMAALQEIMSTIDNEALISQMEIFMSNFQKENIIMTIEALISNFREMITAIQEGRFIDFFNMMQNSWGMINIIDIDMLSNLLDNETLANTIHESISTIVSRLLLHNLSVEDLIHNIENEINAIRNQIITGTMDCGLLDLFSNIMVQWMVEGKNTITFADQGVTTTISMSGLESVSLGEGGEVTVTLSAAFDQAGYTLGSSSCRYTGNGDGSADLEAVIVINISNTIPMIDVKSVEVTAYNTLHASYPTHEVQYEDWTVSYAIDSANMLNASFLSMIQNMIQLPENFMDNREYNVNGVFSLNGNMYDISEMHYVKKEQNDGTSHLSINGNIFANLFGTDVSVDVASDTIKCDSDGIWYDSQMGFTIDQDPVNVLFDWNGAATIIDQTISLWQDILNPLN